MTEHEAYAWLMNHTLDTVQQLLVGWSPQMIWIDSTKAFTAIHRNGVMFAAEVRASDGHLNAKVRAMALAIAAGEMKIDSITEIAIPK